MEEWEWSDSFDCWAWRPLIRWSMPEVVAIHERHKLRPNPLYIAGATRVGCFPCIFSRKAEVALLPRLAPERVEQIAELERIATETARARGTPEANLPRTFFCGKRTRTASPFPIASAVEWSTGFGQEDLFEEDEQGGCVRWGLCDATPRGAA